jgi:hypothetical protein
MSESISSHNKRPRQTFTITGLPPDEDAEHYDKYEKERTTEIDTSLVQPIVNDEHGLIPDGSRLWNEPRPPPPYVLNHNHLMKIYNRDIIIYDNKLTMIQYIHNMVQTAMCLLKSKNDRYEVKYIASGGFGATFKLTYRNQEHAIKFQIYDYKFPLEQKTLSKFNVVKPEIAVKFHKYCYVHFPKQQFYAAIIVMDLIDGTLQELLAKHNLAEETVTDIANQVFNILDLMKKYKLSHCDMLPGNIAYKKLPNNQYQILLIDFGWGSFNSNFPDLDYLSLLRGSMNVKYTFAEQLFSNIICDQAPRRLSPIAYQSIIITNTNTIDSTLLDKYYLGILYDGYQKMKTQQAHDVIMEQASRTTQTVTGKRGPSNKMKPPPTRSKYPQTSKRIRVNSHNDDDDVNIPSQPHESYNETSPVCNEHRCPNGTPSPSSL